MACRKLWVSFFCGSGGKSQRRSHAECVKRIDGRSSLREDPGKLLKWGTCNCRLVSALFLHYLFRSHRRIFYRNPLPISVSSLPWRHISAKIQRVSMWIPGVRQWKRSGRKKQIMQYFQLKILYATSLKYFLLSYNNRFIKASFDIKKQAESSNFLLLSDDSACFCLSLQITYGK